MRSFRRNVKASAEFSCSAELMYGILTDYDHYSEWMPHVPKSALLAEAGELAIASLDYAPPDEMHIWMECIHTLNRSVLGRVIEGECPVTSFEWDLDPLGPEQCRVTLTLTGETSLPVGFGSHEGLNAEQKLQALKSYADAYMPQLILEGEPGEMVLEVFESEDGLVCWYQGRKYQMKPMEETGK